MNHEKNNENIRNTLQGAPVHRLGESPENFIERYKIWYRNERVPALTEDKFKEIEKIINKLETCKIIGDHTAFGGIIERSVCVDCESEDHEKSCDILRLRVLIEHLKKII